MKRGDSPSNLNEFLFGVYHCNSEPRQVRRTTARLSPSEVINLVTLLNPEHLKRQNVIPKDDAVYEALLEILENQEARDTPFVAAIWVDGVFGVVPCDDPNTLKVTPSELIAAYERAYRLSAFQFHKPLAERLLCS